MSTSDNQTVCGSDVHMHVCQCLATEPLSSVHTHICQRLTTKPCVVQHSHARMPMSGNRPVSRQSHSHMLASYNQRVWLRHSQHVCKWLTTKRVLFDWAWCNQAHAHGCSHAHGACVRMHTCLGACNMCESMVQLHTGHDVCTHMCVGCMQYG